LGEPAHRGHRTKRAQHLGQAKSIRRVFTRMKFTFVFYVEIDSRLCSTTRRPDSASQRTVSEYLSPHCVRICICICHAQWSRLPNIMANQDSLDSLSFRSVFALLGLFLWSPISSNKFVGFDCLDIVFHRPV